MPNAFGDELSEVLDIFLCRLLLYETLDWLDIFGRSSEDREVVKVCGSIRTDIAIPLNIPYIASELSELMPFYLRLVGRRIASKLPRKHRMRRLPLIGRRNRIMFL